MKLSTIVAGSATSVLLLSGLALAQQYQQGQGQPLGRSEVRQFVSQIEHDVNQMVQSRDLSRLRQWTQNHVADHAVLSRTNTLETEGHSRVMSSVTITKPDLMRLQRLVVSGMSEKLASIEDYRLNIQVQNVEPVGDSAAIVKSRISETATLTPRGEGGRIGQRDRDLTTGQAQSEAGEDFEEGQQRRRPGRGQPGSVQIELQATCTHLIERSRDAGRLQIGMGVCDATTEAQL
jgi:hypothetical protein